MSDGKKQLEWGRTPWDDLSRDELLREVQRMASALQSANSVLKVAEAIGSEHPFWTEGTGARAVAKVDQALARLDDYDSENVYRSFFRYADDLLFKRVPNIAIGFGWAVCSECGQMIGERMDGVSAAGTHCADHLNKTCPGIFRTLTWDDLAPKA